METELEKRYKLLDSYSRALVGMEIMRIYVECLIKAGVFDSKDFIESKQLS
jgi:hypothetical protein